MIFWVSNSLYFFPIVHFCLPAFLNLAEYFGIVEALISCTIMASICKPTIRCSVEAYSISEHAQFPFYDRYDLPEEIGSCPCTHFDTRLCPTIQIESIKPTHLLTESSQTIVSLDEYKHTPIKMYL